jgi:hypothetical protein
MDNEKYGKFVSSLIAAWFVFALSAAALHLFQTAPNSPPLTFGLAVLVPLIVFLLWFRLSTGFRQFVLSLNPRTLTMVQSWRVAGFVFLALYTYSILPGNLALPAGWGDIAIGVTAPLASMKLANSAHRKGFIAWQMLGMLDLAMAIAMGTMSRIVNPHGISTEPMTVLPLSLIPTFAVPFLFMLHIICIAQAKLWHEPQPVHSGEPLPNAVA